PRATCCVPTRRSSDLFRAPSHPIAQVATLLVAGAVLIGAVMIGAVLLVGLLALGVLAAIVVSLRLWWERRRSARPRQASRPGREDRKSTRLNSSHVKI